MVIDVVTWSRGMPSKSVSMSESDDTATPHLPTSPSESGWSGSSSHQGRKVERDREPSPAVLEQVLEAGVRLGGAAVPGELPHGPEPAAVHRLVDAARVRVLPGVAEVAGVVEAVVSEGAVDRLEIV